MDSLQEELEICKQQLGLFKRAERERVRPCLNTLKHIFIGRNGRCIRRTHHRSREESKRGSISC